MELQQAIDADEVQALTAQWGIAPHEAYQLAVDYPFLSGTHQRLVSDGRRAEICYVMHRGEPSEGVLLHRKTFYPPAAYRLPTGGIHPGEAVLATLTREIAEETGLLVGPSVDQVQVQRFLGITSYTFNHRTLGRPVAFATYHFLVQMPLAAILDPQDPEEMVADWQWRPARELDHVAVFLENIGDHDPNWADWGRFRALSQRFVGRQLRPNP